MMFSMTWHTVDEIIYHWHEEEKQMNNERAALKFAFERKKKRKRAQHVP